MLPQNNGGMPGFGASWGNQHPQHPGQTQASHQPQMNAFQMQHQMRSQLMQQQQQQQQHHHQQQQQHGGQSQMMPPGIGGGQMGQQGHAGMPNNMMMGQAGGMNHQTMGGSVQAQPAGGMVGGQGMQPNAQTFQGMPQQFQQQQQQQPPNSMAQQGGGGSTQDPLAQMMGGGGAPGGMGGFHQPQQQQQQQQQQHQAALYWNALQASGGHQGQQQGQQQQQRQEQRQQQQQHGMSAAPSVMPQGINQPQQQQPQGMLAQMQQQGNSNQGQGSSNNLTQQGQLAPAPDSQTQLLLQQQNLIAQLQRQLQQQRAGQSQLPVGDASAMPTNPSPLLGGQQGGMGIAMGGVGGGGQNSNNNLPPSNNPMGPRFGNNNKMPLQQSPSLTSVGEGSQHGQNHQQQRPPSSTAPGGGGPNFPPALDGLLQRQNSGSFGLALPISPEQNQNRKKLGQLPQGLPNLPGMAMHGGGPQQPPQQSNNAMNQFHDIFGGGMPGSQAPAPPPAPTQLPTPSQLQAQDKANKRGGGASQQKQSQRSSIDDDTPLIGPLGSPHPRGGLSSTAPSNASASSPRVGVSGPPGQQIPAGGPGLGNMPSQQTMDSMRRAASSAASGATHQTGGSGGGAPPQASQAQQQHKQHKLLMAHMLQRQMNPPAQGGAGKSGAGGSAPPPPSGLGSGLGSGGLGVGVGGMAPTGRGVAAMAAGSGGGGQGAMLEQRVKQFQVMQHLQQLQQQTSGNGDDSSNAVEGGKVKQPPKKKPPPAKRGRPPGSSKAKAAEKKAALAAAETGTAKGKVAKVGFSAQHNSSLGSLTQGAFVDGVSRSLGIADAKDPLGDGAGASGGGSGVRPLRPMGVGDPDPIADGVNASSGASSSAPMVGSGAGGGGGGSGDGEGKQQSFLDGHFVGGWQSNADLPDRRRINFHIIKVIERMRPDANRMSQNRLPLMTKKLEEHLYRSAHTKEEYIDPASLKRRLHLIAKGVGIPKPGEGDDTSNNALADHVGGGGSATNSTVSSAPPPVPLEAMSQGLSAGMSVPAMAGASSSDDPQQNTNQAQQQEQQMLSQQSQSQSQKLAVQQIQQLQPSSQGSVKGANTSASNNTQSSTKATSAPLQESAPNQGASKSDKKKVILLQQQRRLLLLRHASKCDAGPSCRTKFCSQMVTLWKHMKKCRDKHCKVSHCLSSRCVLNHYRICKSEQKTASCAICAPVIQHIRQSSDGMGATCGLAGSEGDELDTIALGSDGGLLTGEDPLDAQAIDAPGVGDDEVIGMGVGGAFGQTSTVAGDMQERSQADPFNALRMGTSNDAMSPLPTPGVQGAVPQNISILPQSQEQQTKNDMGTSQAGLMGFPQGALNNGAVSQAGLMGFPQNQAEPSSIGSVQDMQQEFQKKQLLLRQVQQQKANLFGQSQKLQQQLVSACNPQQAQQLQKQQAILQQLNQQFEQQQSILHSEIQRQAITLQQRHQQQQQQSDVGSTQASTTVTISNNYDSISTMNESKGKKDRATKKKDAKSASAAASPKKVSGSNTSKRKTYDGKDERSNKKSKFVRPSSNAAHKPREKSIRNGSTTNLPPDGVAKKPLSVAGASSSASDKKSEGGPLSSLIPSMPVPVVERHLDSLVNPGQHTPRYIARKCLPLVQKLINHEDGWVFKDAVDPVELGIPDYFDIVKCPMDLTLVVNKLKDGAYKDLASFERDTKLVFENAILFNGADSDVGNMAQGLLDIFAADLKSALKGE